MLTGVACHLLLSWVTPFLLWEWLLCQGSFDTARTIRLRRPSGYAPENTFDQPRRGRENGFWVSPRLLAYRIAFFEKPGFRSTEYSLHTTHHFHILLLIRATLLHPEYILIVRTWHV
jgi:hypothetical protein